MAAFAVEHEGRTLVLGRHLFPLHDVRNRAFPAATAPLGTVRWERSDVLDQGDVGSCTGNALAGWFNTAPQEAHDGRLRTEADALRYYSRGTALDAYPGAYPPVDSGCDGPSVCKGAMKAGELGGYKHAFGLAHFLGALQLGSVMVGTKWLQGMFSPDRSGVVVPCGAVKGGHEYEAIGYDATTRLIEFANSWGTGWGVAGCFFIHEADFGHLLADHGDVTVPHL